MFSGSCYKSRRKQMNALFRVQNNKWMCTCVPVLPMASPDLRENKNQRDEGQTYYSVINIQHHQTVPTRNCADEMDQFFLALLRKENKGRERKVTAVGHKPWFHRWGLSLVLDWNVILSCFNWNKLALTDLKIYQCLCFVSRCTRNVFF